jgi:hypothetical protein
MKAARRVSGSVGWKTLGWFCGIIMSLAVSAQAQTSSPLGAVLTVPTLDFNNGRISPLDSSIRVNRLHYNDQITTLSFAPGIQSTGAAIQIQVPPESLSLIRQMNYLPASGTSPIVSIPPKQGNYTSGPTGTRFYLVPLTCWNTFRGQNLSKQPIMTHQVYYTQPMVLAGYDPPNTDIALPPTCGGFSLQGLNTGVTSPPVGGSVPRSFISVPNLDATVVLPGSSQFRLTSSRTSQQGAAWFLEKQFVAGGFLTTFQFRMTGLGADRPNIERGADGFAFVIQNYSLTYRRLTGGFLGYHNLPNSLAIEFDTYHNREPGFLDPDGNHISIHTLGTGPNSVSESARIGYPSTVGITSAIPTLNDGLVHLAQIYYQPGILAVYVDDLLNPVLIVRGLDLSRIISLDAGRAWMGFTAATGASFQTHDILAWDFEARAFPGFIQN